MANTKVKSVVRWVALGFGVALLILLAGGITGMIGTTMLNWWVFFGIIVIVAAATGTVLHRGWEKLTGTRKFYINFPLHMVVFTIVAAAALLMGNYYGSDFSSFQEEKVIVNQKIRKTRYQTKRISRRVYTRGAPYYVHYVDITLPDDTRKEIFVNRNVYNKAHVGDTATIRMGRGALSFRVIDPNSLKLPSTRHKSRSRCKFFGTSGRK